MLLNIAKKLSILVLLIKLSHSTIACMEQIDNKINDEDLVIEQLPNEILFSIFIERINNIIETNNPKRAEIEFKKFFYNMCLVNKDFYNLAGNLKQYFDANKKYMIQDIRNIIFSKLNPDWEAE